MSLWDYCYNFFCDWIFDSESLTLSNLFVLDGSISNIEIVNFLSIALIFIVIYLAIYVIKWFINFVIGLGGVYK